MTRLKEQKVYKRVVIMGVFAWMSGASHDAQAHEQTTYGERIKHTNFFDISFTLLQRDDDDELKKQAMVTMMTITEIVFLAVIQ